MNVKKIKGYALGFIAAATYGLNPLFALPLMDDGMDTSSILFFRYLLALPVMAAMIVVRGKSFKVSRRQLGLLAVFGLLVGLSSVTLFESYRYMDAGIASTLLFVYPLMVALIMAAMFHERVTPVTVLCLATALVGIGLLYKGEDGAVLSVTGTLLVMLSALSYAIYIVGVNKSQLSRVPTLTVTFYVLLFGLLIFVGDIVLKQHVTIPAGVAQWGRVGALALLPTAVSFLCTTLAITYIGSTPTAILGAMEPLTAVVVGVVVFHETLTPRILVGLVLIIIAVSLVVVGGKISVHLTAIRRLFPRHRR
ncbi:DMT family transporter [Barnesiella sp. WM24]|uniref:DMT family transporter n=1 Tax=Barnesiella sp. WM24 TaxID=2558278 RepID=UPI0010728DCA|nr:DMT family transporter [Barnesiella sp. WM24]TFU94110.1 DMT family transporter [Barnesiella sp. WM24]